MTYADHPLGQYGGINPQLYKRRQKEEKEKREAKRIAESLAAHNIKNILRGIEPSSNPAEKVSFKFGSPELDFKGKKPTVRMIALSICKRYNHDFDSLVGAKKNRLVMKFRSELYVEAYLRRPDKSLVEIGMEIGGRDHSTLINTLKKIGVYGATRLFKDVDKRQLALRRQEGLTLKECAKHFNSDVYSIWCQLNENTSNDDKNDLLLIKYLVKDAKSNEVDKGMACIDTINEIIFKAIDNGHTATFWPHEGE